MLIVSLIKFARNSATKMNAVSGTETSFLVTTRSPKDVKLAIQYLSPGQ